MPDEKEIPPGQKASAPGGTPRGDAVEGRERLEQARGRYVWRLAHTAREVYEWIEHLGEETPPTDTTLFAGEATVLRGLLAPILVQPGADYEALRGYGVKPASLCSAVCHRALGDRFYRVARRMWSLLEAIPDAVRQGREQPTQRSVADWQKAVSRLGEALTDHATLGECVEMLRTQGEPGRQNQRPHAADLVEQTQAGVRAVVARQEQYEQGSQRVAADIERPTSDTGRDELPEAPPPKGGVIKLQSVVVDGIRHLGWLAESEEIVVPTVTHRIDEPPPLILGTERASPVRKAPQDHTPDDDMPDERGFVKNPKDHTAYRPATEILNKHTPPLVATTYKQLKAILRRHPEVRRTRPKGKQGEPRPNRLNVHLADWHKLKEKLLVPSADSDGWPPVSDEEVADRKAAIRRTKKPRQ